MLEYFRVNPFARTEEHELLAENFRRLLHGSNEFSSRRERLARSAPNRLALWPAFTDQGVLGAAFDEVSGGFAGDPRTIAVVMAEIGVGLAVEPFLAAAVMTGRILVHWTNDAARQATIDSIIAGRRICIIAHSTFDDPFAGPCVHATASGGSILLSGFVPAVRHAEVANEFLVPAWSPDRTIEFFRVERQQGGLAVESYRLIDAAGAADLRFDNVRLPVSSRMQFDTSARDAFDEALEWGILGLAAESAGIVGALNAATFSYLMARKQFGAVLGSFQALQHRAADMWIAAEEIIAIVDLAIDSMTSTTRSMRESVISAAKVVADQRGRHVGNEAVQLHGGMGVSDELVVSHYFRRLATIRGELGSADAHRLRFRSKQ
jgi:alkylation response protein AidB-like acyl-CoA dehydrogenase